MRTTARLAATLLTTSIAVAGTATVAAAETTTLKDKASDVLSYTSMKDERGTVLGYAESVASGVDLRSLRVKHTKKSVGVTVKFSSLNGDALPMVSIRLDGRSKPSRFVVVAGEGKARVIDTQETRRCHAPMTVRLGAKGYLNVVVPRSCLGDPRRVKVSAFAATEGLQDDNAPFLTDAVSPTNVHAQHWTKWLKAS
ncbi:hypothetical protein [Aeromicrobium wangtongii]|uniref:Uncharacterized protein n=1 Tax=Aeromicrobium wangtongii TaxID=2969247 RepID=A0ABY5MCY2_9ACTN|nr:hypothetical protein [Aeromicrobium wangtongii]MCD9197578.1 hypothetical protein [Aeromicrobium wangtongii]UUP15069.1 hypothetical protein NQV15_07080 [Aeromicrobium wangtongii]